MNTHQIKHSRKRPAPAGPQVIFVSQVLPAGELP